MHMSKLRESFIYNNLGRVYFSLYSSKVYTTRGGEKLVARRVVITSDVEVVPIESSMYWRSSVEILGWVAGESKTSKNQKTLQRKPMAPVT